MKAKSILQANPYLKNRSAVREQLIRSVASSTAVETGESIQRIEARLKQKSSSFQVKLA